uniref:Uncharacterized protein n=1 Tax=Panagrolaimus sp. PS1159 TaxID=55785 RepID=A0AC35F8N3_9BILA
MIFDGLLIAIKKPTSYAAFDGFDPNAKFEYKNDYANEKINVILNECLKQIGKYFPSDLKNLGYMKASGTRPDYTNNGLLYYLFLEGLKDYEKFDCNYFIGFCSAANSFKMCKKIGMKKVFTFPYPEYKANGKPIFQNFPDGATGIQVMIGRTDVAMDILTGKKVPAAHL